MWKDFFYFTKRERIGIYVMSILIILIIVANYSISLWQSEFIFNIENQEEIDAFINSIQKREGNIISSNHSENINDLQQKFDTPRQFNKNLTSKLFFFDPNTADSIDFLYLGLRPYVIRNILKYRAKQGKFHFPKDFSKIYGLSSQQYAILLPYIRIGKEFCIYGNGKEKMSTFVKNKNYKVSQTSKQATHQKNLAHFPKDRLYTAANTQNKNKYTTKNNITNIKIFPKEPVENSQNSSYSIKRTINNLQSFPNDTKTNKNTFYKSLKYPEGTRVSLNEADTTELKKVPGIGSMLARTIIAYRNRLGGFYDIKQLQEIQHIPLQIHKWFYISSVPLRRLNLNKASMEKMYAHPYLNFYQAKVIFEYRKKRGSLKSLQQLSLYEEFTEKDLERLSHYIEL